MNGGHDLGGMDGFGAVDADPVAFHHEWERRVFALVLACGRLGRWNVDMSRFSRENVAPGVYLNETYFERWLRGLQHLLVAKGVLTPAELASGVQSDAAGINADVGGEAVAPTPQADGDLRGRFGPGDSVRVKNLHPRGHTRLPRYIRGRAGTVHAALPACPDPERNAETGGAAPAACYSVRFAATTLWGPDASPHDYVHVDVWDKHLEPA